MPKPRYDVFEFDEPAFELVSDAEMHSGRPDPTADDMRDHDEGTKIAHAVTAATAAELVGLSPAWIDRLEREVAEHGVFGVGNLRESFDVKRTRE